MYGMKHAGVACHVEYGNRRPRSLQSAAIVQALIPLATSLQQVNASNSCNPSKHQKLHVLMTDGSPICNCIQSLRANKGPGQGESLLQYKTGTTNGSVMVRLAHGQAIMPDLEVTDSSEALLKGRRPPFRLLVWPASVASGVQSSSTGSSADPASLLATLEGRPTAATAAGRSLAGVLYAVSDEFVVATRRVKQANKVEIPLVDDNVGKIEHIGRETVKKLMDLYAAAAESGTILQLDERLRKVDTGNMGLLCGLQTHGI